MSVAPLRRQYLQIKKQYPDVLVLFRLGDFYETFDDDAKIAASVLGIALTGREMGKGQRVPMAGIPHHALDNYLGKLIDAGHKVAVCEQTSDSVESRGLVDREVVRVVTPGTVVEPNLLDAKANNYLVAVCVDGEEAGIAYVDITTSEFATTQLEASGVALELGRLQPPELLLPTGFEPFEEWRRGSVTDLDPRAFDTETARELLLRHFGVTTLEGYGCDHAPLAVGAAGAVLAYLADTQKGALAQITGLSTYSTQAYMTLDPQTRRNLELFEGGRWGGAESSLIRVLDLTKNRHGRPTSPPVAWPAPSGPSGARPPPRRRRVARTAHYFPGTDHGAAGEHLRPGAAVQPRSFRAGDAPGARGPAPKPGARAGGAAGPGGAGAGRGRESGRRARRGAQALRGRGRPHRRRHQRRPPGGAGRGGGHQGRLQRGAGHAEGRLPQRPGAPGGPGAEGARADRDQEPQGGL